MLPIRIRKATCSARRVVLGDAGENTELVVNATATKPLTAPEQVGTERLADRSTLTSPSRSTSR